jgi:hypothetical protein
MNNNRTVIRQSEINLQIKQLKQTKRRIIESNQAANKNAQCIIYVSQPKKTLRVKISKAKGDCPKRGHSDQRFLGTV